MSAIAFVTQKSTQNRARTLRLGDIVILIFSKILTKIPLLLHRALISQKSTNYLCRTELYMTKIQKF